MGLDVVLRDQAVISEPQEPGIALLVQYTVLVEGVHYTVVVEACLNPGNQPPSSKITLQA